jgi:putative ABC transport system ATP-binding protein
MIELQNVCRTFTVGDQQVAALRDINLRLDAREYVSIMGPSGSGKSTLLNLLGLLDRPTSGTYLLDEGNVTDLSSRQTCAATRSASCSSRSIWYRDSPPHRMSSCR